MSPRAIVGSPVEYRDEVASTNDEIAARAARGGSEGLTLVAGAQTCGRGRQGRSWHSPPGSGLYVSVLLRPPAAVAPLLTLAGGVALCEAVREATGLEATIKWPNDLLSPDGKRKLAGILVEGSATGDRMDYAVFGYGINVRPSAYPPDIRGSATSLEEELGRPVDPSLVLRTTLDAIDARYRDLLDGRAALVLARWKELSPRAVGAPIEWTVGGVRRQGVSSGIDQSGALLARRGGEVERIVSGEVRWL